MRYKRTIVSLILSIWLMGLNGFALDYTDGASMTYDLRYSVAEAADGIDVTVDYTIINNRSTEETPLLLLALYENEILVQLVSKTLPVSAGVPESYTLTITAPNASGYTIMAMAWENERTIRPLGMARTIDAYAELRGEKYIFVTANQDAEFRIFMNADNVEGDGTESTHTIVYDPEKIAPVDLCGFTYEKELSAGNVENAGIIINQAAPGEIQYTLTMPQGNNTGVNNVIRFKALQDLKDEQITYSIQ